MKEIKLDTRQWFVYTLIKYNTLNDKRLTKLEEIVDKWNATSEKNKYVMHDKAHDKCVSVRNDIDKINLSHEIQRIIIVNEDYTYKLAESEQEVYEMLDRIYYQVAYHKLVKASRLQDKLSKNQQCRLFTNDLQPIYTKDKNDNLKLVSNKVREFIEVFEVKKQSESEDNSTSDKNAQ